jgi:hypothetical protein
MSKQFGVFSVETAAEIHRRVLGNSSPQKPTDGQKRLLLPAREYYVKLTEDLAEASNPETGYTQAEAVFLRYKQPAEDTLSMEESGEDSTLTVTNRSTSYSATSGSVLQVKRIGAEWAPVHASGGANSTSDACPCDCLGTGDLIVEDVLTVSQFRITLGDLEFRQENGVITLPGGVYIVYWDDFLGKWVLDIGDDLRAVYNNGDDATAESILDGTVVLEYDGDKSYVRVCIDALIGPVTGTGTGTAVIISPPGTPGNPGGEVCIPGGDIYCPQFLAAFNYGFENGAIDGSQGNPYDDRVIYAGASGTGAGTGNNQQFGTGTWLAPGTGTYGLGTGSGSGTASWSDEEEAFYQGYRSGYAEGYAYGKNAASVPHYGTGTANLLNGWLGTGTFTPDYLGTGSP